MEVLKKSNLFKRVGLLLAALVLTAAILIISGCGKENADASLNDIITQKEVGTGRQNITILVKYAFTINTFEEAVEKKFPNINIIQVGNYTSSMGVTEYEARLEHNDLPDMVMTWPLEVGEEYWSDNLMDLSGFDFTGRYNLSMLNDISRDGKLYYLPGPSQVRGILYNKTLFEENGWQVPKDYIGFVKLCKDIEKAGIRPLQLGFSNSEVLDTAFVGYGYNQCFSKPQDSQWLSDYNDGTGSFGDHFGPALDNFEDLINDGIIKKEDLNVNYSDREKMIFTRQCAMVEDSVLMAKMGYEQTGTTDEFALMPFFNPNNGGDWARLYMVCYIGLNKNLAEPENKIKYNQVMDLMDYISSPEGQEALMGDTGAMFSSLTEVEPPNVPEIADLQNALQSGRYGVFPQLKNAQGALRQGLSGMLLGQMTKADVIKMVDSENANPPKQEPPEVFGTASQNFTLLETGNYIVDAMRAETGCDFALFLDNGKDGKYNGKGVSAKIYKGDVTASDIGRIIPDLKSKATEDLYKISMTGEDLLKTLEYPVTVDKVNVGWFYYFSGLKMTFDPVAEPGSRVKKITTADDKDIDPKKTYSVAIMADSVPSEYIKTSEKTAETISSTLIKTIKNSKDISPAKDGRFIIAK